MHRSMPSPLINSIHQSIGVAMDKFLELVAKEIEFSTNEILKICKTRKEDQLIPPIAHSKCIGAFQIRK